MPLSFTEVVAPSLFVAPFAWRMGVRSISVDDWLQPDDAAPRDLAEKHSLLLRIPDAVVGWMPGSEPAADQVLRLVEADLARRPANADPDPGPPGPPPLHPLDAAARRVQEDLCLMEVTGGGWTLTAGSVCFPTRWSLREKLGCSLAAIHDPVPGYAGRLGVAVDRYFDRMEEGRVVERCNWSVVDTGARRLPPRRRQAPVGFPPDPAHDLFLRVERQTLRRLVGRPAICFGIRIHAWSFAEVMDDVDRVALAEMLRTMPGDVAAYKNLEGIRGPLAQWLDPG